MVLQHPDDVVPAHCFMRGMRHIEAVMVLAGKNRRGKVADCIEAYVDLAVCVADKSPEVLKAAELARKTFLHGPVLQGQR